MLIAVIGGVGSGKSKVLTILERDFSICGLRTDEVAGDLYRRGNPVFHALLRLLPDIGTASGEGIDKRKLAERIYGDAALRKEVEGIVHPAVWQEVERRMLLSRERGESLAVETALPEEHFLRACTEVWFVYAEREVRISRLRKGRGYSRAYAERIIDSQRSDEEYRSLSDWTLDNSGSEEETRDEIYEHCKRLERECKLYRR